MNQTSLKPLWELCAASVPQLRSERFQRLENFLVEQNLEALIVLASATLGIKGSLRYVANFSPTSRYAGVLFPRQGPPLLLVPYAVHVAWAESISWIDDVRFSRDFALDMSGHLREQGLTNGRVGIVGENTIPNFRKHLTGDLTKTELVDITAAFTHLRVTKSPSEVLLARHAASMADQVLEQSASLINEGTTEIEIFAESEKTLRGFGAEESLLLIDSLGGQITPYPTRRKINPGNLIQYSVEPVSPGGHWIQSVRMYCHGKPRPESRQIAEIFKDALSMVENTLTAGVPICRIAQMIAEVLAPIAPQGRIPYGHGIGMDNFEPPVVHVESDVIAESNMVIVVHPALIVDNQNYYFGDTYLVTESGAERLTKYPLDLIVV